MAYNAKNFISDKQEVDWVTPLSKLFVTGINKLGEVKKLALDTTTGGVTSVLNAKKNPDLNINPDNSGGGLNTGFNMNQDYGNFKGIGKNNISFSGLNMGKGGKMKCAQGGQLTTYNGYKHEQGGIALGKDEVEDGETSLPTKNNEKYIFPDNKFSNVPGTKRTFADESKNIDKKYSLRDWDKISNNAKEKELNTLKAVHEGMKQVLEQKALLNFEKKNPGLFSKLVDEASNQKLQQLSQNTAQSSSEFSQNSPKQFASGGGTDKYDTQTDMGDGLTLNQLKYNPYTAQAAKSADPYKATNANYSDFSTQTIGNTNQYTGQGYTATQTNAEKVDLGQIGQLKQKAFNREDNTEELKQYDDASQIGQRMALSDPTSGNSTVAAMAAGAVGAKNKALAMAQFNNRQAERRDQYNQVGYGLESQNIGNKLGAMSTNAQLGTQTNLANMGAKNQASQFGASALNESARFNAESLNQTNQFNTSALNQVGMFNTGQKNAMSQFNAGQQNQAGMFNVGQQNNMSQFNVGQQNQIGLNNTNMDYTARTDNANRREGLEMSKYQIKQNRENAKAQQKQQWINAGASILGAGIGLLSDKKTKENIKKLDNINGINIYKYNYKDKYQKSQNLPSEEQIGVIAQEVEKKIPGSVIEKNGLKRVNYGKVLNYINK